jgi:hypothetical protein
MEEHIRMVEDFKEEKDEVTLDTILKELGIAAQKLDENGNPISVPKAPEMGLITSGEAHGKEMFE